MKLLFFVCMLVVVQQSCCIEFDWTQWSGRSKVCEIGRNSTVTRERTRAVIKRLPSCDNCYEEFLETQSERCSTFMNVALHKHATSSSTFSNGRPELAIDGDTNGNFRYGSCMHTKLEKDPYLKIDLGSFYVIQEVIVFNRVDCCTARANNLTITIGFDKDGDNPLCGRKENMNLAVARFYCPTLEGKYVFLRIPGYQYLHLCEVQILGNKIDACTLSGKTIQVNETVVPDTCDRKCKCVSHQEKPQLICEPLCKRTNITCDPGKKVVLVEKPVDLNPKCSCEIQSCVPRTDVCTLSGKTIQVNETVVPDTCEQKCTCISHNVEPQLICEPLCEKTNVTCGPDEKLVLVKKPVDLNPNCSCEIQRCVSVPNIALRKHVTALTAWKGTPITRAVDGNVSTYFETIINENNPWIKIDLGGKAYTYKVHLYIEGDNDDDVEYLKDSIVTVGYENSFKECGVAGMIKLTTGKEGWRYYPVKCPSTMEGRYVKLQLLSTYTKICIGEFEVYGYIET